MFSKLWCLFLLALVLTPSLNPSGLSPGALAQVDVEEGEDVDEMEVEDEEEETVTVPDQKDETVKTDVLDEDEEEDELDEVKKIGPHPDASTTLIFVNRPSNQLSAGEIVETLIGFTNDAEETGFIVTAIEGSFRYPQDFNYFIQNFSVDPYETFIHPQTQVSFQYNFMPSESFYARPFGLTVNVHYKDVAGEIYRDAVFNDTVNIVEVEENFDGETFFMYVFMVSGISLLMFIIHYVYTTTMRKSSRSKKTIETGTQKNTDVDYSWLPEGTTIPGTPTAKKSPRMRKNKK